MRFIVEAIRDAMIPYDENGGEYETLYEREFFDDFKSCIKNKLQYSTLHAVMEDTSQIFTM
ncbi:MAG: hypothetical protein ACP6IU_11900 [Candidatus Asgardarchaeia archaeon]